MQIEDLISGYSNLFRQFKSRTRTETDIENLNLKFYLDDRDLIAAEEGTDNLIILAIFNRYLGRWRFELTPGSPAREMVKYVCANNEVKMVPKRLQEDFYILFRRLF